MLQVNAQKFIINLCTIVPVYSTIEINVHSWRADVLIRTIALHAFIWEWLISEMFRCEARSNLSFYLSSRGLRTFCSLIQNLNWWNSCWITNHIKLPLSNKQLTPAFCYWIFLIKHKKVSKCFREICEQLPGPHSNVLLGDAFMKIQEVHLDFFMHVFYVNHYFYSHDKIKQCFFFYLIARKSHWGLSRSSKNGTRWCNTCQENRPSHGEDTPVW